jgi:hypothetical protein
VAVYDPRVGEIRSHRKLRHWIAENHSWLVARHARVEQVASTYADGRGVLELLAYLSDEDGQGIGWPVAVLTESPDDLSLCSARTAASGQLSDGGLSGLQFCRRVTHTLVMSSPVTRQRWIPGTSTRS